MLPDAIRPAMQGVVPSVLVTCSLDGIPNVAFVSQVWYVDSEHVALSFQFFNKTIRNIRENPRAVVRVLDPETLVQWELELTYLRTETEGQVFDEMEIKLEAIASMTGMSGVFHLKGADLYRVRSVRMCDELYQREGDSA